MHATSRKLLSPMLSLGFLAMAFRFDDNGIHWLWANQPGVAVVLGCAALGLLAVALLQPRRHAH